MSKKLLFNAITLVFITAKVFAQTKTFKETFNVGDNTILNITTTNTDIEFETWDKNQVEITATITLEGAADEEAERYFKNNQIEIKGNSKVIDITTGRNYKGLFRDSQTYWLEADIDFKIEPFFEDLKFPELSNLSELSELSELAELVAIPELPVIPELPDMPNVEFDYDAYKKDGDKYMKKWQKQFEKSYNKEFKENFEEWGEKFKELNEKRFDELSKLKEKRRAKLLSERNKKLVEKSQKRDLLLTQRDSLFVIRDKARAIRDYLRFPIRDTLRSSKPNIFYLSSDKKNKKYKIKKSIKIKMPKSVKLKMNVRHGEVKLAATTKDLKASLQYASLLASTIEGRATDISAAYTPVLVQKWNYGQLKTDYSDRVNLKEVGELRLNAVSSNIVIDKLTKSALLSSNLGSVQIKSVSNNFKDIDVSLQNGEFDCKISKFPVSIYLNGTKSTIVYPSEWTVDHNKNYDVEVYKGYQIRPNSGKSIRVNSKYSEVTLKN